MYKICRIDIVYSCQPVIMTVHSIEMNHTDNPLSAKENALRKRFKIAEQTLLIHLQSENVS